MRSKISLLICLLACFAIAIPLLAVPQGSNPLTGTWTGDWGPSPEDRNTISLDLKLDGKTVTGVVHSINPERPDVTLEKSTFNPATGDVHMEVQVPNSKKGYRPLHYVIKGKVANGTMSGSWNHANKKGDFKVTKK